MVAWHQQKHKIIPADTVQVDVVRAFIEQTPNLTYIMHSLSVISRGWSPYVKGRTVLRALDKGHTDIEVWCYANPMTPVPVWSTAFQSYRTDYEATGKTQSWVVDIDDVTAISSIDELYLAMVARGVPLPYFTTQSGPHNFHCMYLGQFGEWPEHKRRWLVEKWAGLRGLNLPKEEWERRLKASGIDPAYYARTIGKHAFRVPGSLNPNHRIDGQMWRCVGGRNPNYVGGHAQYSADCERMPEPQPVVKTGIVVPLPSKRNQPAFHVYSDAIEELLEQVFPRGHECFTNNALAGVIAQNTGGLARKECRIHQVTWAQMLGCDQRSVSRLLKRLISAEVLTKVSDVYAPGVHSKTYGAGALLRTVIGPSGMPLSPPNWTSWDDGTSHTRMLYDVRYFVSLGLADEEVICYLHERQQHRPKAKRRPTSELRGCIKRYRAFLAKRRRSHGLSHEEIALVG